MSGFPTEEQRRVIEFNGRRLVVVAGPGAGKTQTVVERMTGLLRIDAERIVSFLTFTRASRRNTEQKVKTTVGGQAAGAGQLPRVSTLHGFATGLVRRFAPAIGREADFSVLVPDKGEKDILLCEVIDDLSLDVSPQELHRELTRFRSTEEWPSETRLGSSEQTAVVAAFEELLTFYNTFDMEGITWAACQIPTRSGGDVPPVFLQVDEYQDLNPVDQKFIQLASRTDGSQIVVVGDDAQSIYGGRYAHFQGLRVLWESTDWDHERLTQCHRLPPHLLRAAHALIQSRGYLGAELSIPDDNGRRVLTMQCSTADVELRAIAKEIASHRAEGKTREGAPLSYRDFMVLCPSTHLDAVVTALNDNGIPAKARRRASIPDSIWRVLLVLRLLGDQDSLALRQWLDVLGLERDEVARIRHAAMAAHQSLYQYCSVGEPSLARIYEALDGLRGTLIDPAGFAAATAEFPGLDPDDPAKQTIGDVSRFCPAPRLMIRYVYEAYGILDREDEEHKDDRDDTVLVTTMHSAKGLEAEFVFVSRLNARYLPLPGRDPMEEERVLYVAMTRAKQDTILSFHEEWDQRKKRRIRLGAMSPLLAKIARYLELRTVAAGDTK